MSGVKGRSGGPRANAGGKRPGAGRKPSPKILLGDGTNPPTDDKAPVIEIQQGDEPASLAFLRAVVLHPLIDVRIRIDAAKALAPYEAVRKDAAGKRKDAEENAKKAGSGKFAPSAPPKLATVHQLPEKKDTPPPM